MGSNRVCMRTHAGHITLNCDRRNNTVVTSAWSTYLWSSTTSLDLGFEKKVLLFSLVWHCWAVGVSRLWEKEQNSVLCISSLSLTPTQQTWSPTGRLDCESSSSLLTIVLFFLSLSVSFFCCCPSPLFANSYSWEAHSHPKVSVGESCQRAQGLSKQGESSPLPISPLSLSLSLCTAQWNHCGITAENLGRLTDWRPYGDSRKSLHPVVR